MTRLTYSDVDDVAARQYIDDALRERGPDRWTALLAADRIEQTHRVLVEINREVKDKIAEIDKRRQRVARDFQDKVIDAAERRAQLDALDDIDYKTKHFRRVFRTYLMMAEEKFAARRQPADMSHVIDTLRTLAFAVRDHQQVHAGEESLADTALWGRLHTLTVPTHDGVISLREWIA